MNSSNTEQHKRHKAHDDRDDRMAALSDDVLEQIAIKLAGDKLTSELSLHTLVKFFHAYPTRRIIVDVIVGKLLPRVSLQTIEIFFTLLQQTGRLWTFLESFKRKFNLKTNCLNQFEAPSELNAFIPTLKCIKLEYSYHQRLAFESVKTCKEVGQIYFKGQFYDNISYDELTISKVENFVRQFVNVRVLSFLKIYDTDEKRIYISAMLLYHFLKYFGRQLLKINADFAVLDYYKLKKVIGMNRHILLQLNTPKVDAEQLKLILNKFPLHTWDFYDMQYFTEKTENLLDIIATNANRVYLSLNRIYWIIDRYPRLASKIQGLTIDDISSFNEISLLMDGSIKYIDYNYYDDCIDSNGGIFFRYLRNQNVKTVRLMAGDESDDKFMFVLDDIFNMLYRNSLENLIIQRGPYGSSQMKLLADKIAKLESTYERSTALPKLMLYIHWDDYTYIVNDNLQDKLKNVNLQLYY